MNASTPHGALLLAEPMAPVTPPITGAGLRPDGARTGAPRPASTGTRVAGTADVVTDTVSNDLHAGAPCSTAYAGGVGRAGSGTKPALLPVLRSFHAARPLPDGSDATGLPPRAAPV